MIRSGGCHDGDPDQMTINSLNLAMSPVVLGQVNPVVINLLVGVFLLVSIVMILIVLIQRPQGGGLGGAFGAGGSGGGGGGAGQTAFGTKTGDVLTGGTIAIFVLFITFAVILNFVTRPPEATNVQSTIAAPDSTEIIPLEEDAGDEVDAVIDETLQSIEDSAGDAVDAAADQAGEIIDDAKELLESETPVNTTDTPAVPSGNDD